MDYPMRYRKKPVVIDAIQWTGTNVDAIDKFSGKSWTIVLGKVLIPTLEGLMRAQIGDYIIKGVQGEFYPCKADIFHQTYEIM